MMAFYAISRERTLRGLGKTFSFVPRRRSYMRGLGQDAPVITPDFGPAPVISPGQPIPPPIDTTMISAPTQLETPGPSFYTSPAPIIPAQTTTPVTAPNIQAPIPGGPMALPSIVFPSGGTVKPAVQPQATSWLDEELISGFPNKYLAATVVGGILLVSITNAKRRR